MDRWNCSRRARCADCLVILMAVALPWSTTAFGILAGIWLVSFAAISRLDELWKLFRSPQCAFPLALFSLSLIGMLWADVPWPARVSAASTFVKLLAIPLLIYQFERSRKGVDVFLAFLASCTVLLVLSWLNWFDPRTIVFSDRVVGVPVKNWITQGTEFTLCIFGAGALSIINWRSQKYPASLGFGLLSLAFLLNIIFVVASRTALVLLPVFFVIATYRYIDRRQRIMLYGTALLAFGLAWLVSPNLQDRIASIRSQFTAYEEKAELASVGLRIEYWTKSLKFFQEAPFYGHGTGTIRALFERDATKATIGAEVVANPHNQTFYCAIQWGTVGVILLWAMWVCHLCTFQPQSWVSWLGTLIVLQNVFSSLFNSHITDFVEGWIYVLGVGITIGMTFYTRNLEQPNR